MELATIRDAARTLWSIMTIDRLDSPNHRQTECALVILARIQAHRRLAAVRPEPGSVDEMILELIKLLDRDRSVRDDVFLLAGGAARTEEEMQPS